MHIFILIRAHLAHVQKTNKFFALGRPKIGEGGDDKQVINLIRPLLVSSTSGVKFWLQHLL